MQSASAKQDIIERLIKLDSNNNFLLDANVSEEDFLGVKIRVQQDLDTAGKSFKIFSILALICFAITAVISFLKLFNEETGPDLNKKALFILLTVSNMFSAYALRVRVEKLKQQIILLDFLVEGHA